MTVHLHMTRGYDNCVQLIKFLSNSSDVIHLLFLASKNEVGLSWNRTSQQCESVIEEVLESWEHNRRIDILVLEVEKSEWDDPANEFKIDEDFAIFNIPTLKRWGEKAALLGEDCSEDFLVKEYFELNSDLENNIFSRET
uniref:Thioredoxin-like protein Clot n=1 Tax=Lygus hesperus TaxID=30085 RepID=A0A0A9YC95_LYGHE